jgi:uncharacterized Fe-S cluster-containing radical SAM superfamily protein
VVIKTALISEKYRAKIVDRDARRFLMTDFRNSLQERDLTIPPNCNGFGRVRHFRRETSAGWPLNPLPIDPACKALGLPATAILRAQAFQIAACNWRCWYCFVPFDLLSANAKHSAWLGPGDLIDRYLDQESAPPVIDLTGGEPSLVPEWVPWMIEEIRSRGLDGKIYLWSDDNLSNDFFWDVLSEDERKLVAAYPFYGRVCCFKGFNRESFAFNTGAAPEEYDEQFRRMRRLLDSGLDVYGYVTLTTPDADRIAEDIRSNTTKRPCALGASSDRGATRRRDS